LHTVYTVDIASQLLYIDELFAIFTLAVGDTMSLADIAIYACLKGMYFPADKNKEVEDAYAACPKISAIVKAVSANEGIQNWEKVRPATFM
jgi:glutathione S-transferase